MSGLRYPIEMVKGVPVVVAPQEIDAHNADCLRAVLLQAAVRGHATFVVDMTGTQFCASAGRGQGRVASRASPSACHRWAARRRR
jgi:anti-anti-sigma factor